VVANDDMACRQRAIAAALGDDEDRGAWR